MDAAYRCIISSFTELLRATEMLGLARVQQDGVPGGCPTRQGNQGEEEEKEEKEEEEERREKGRNEEKRWENKESLECGPLAARCHPLLRRALPIGNA